MSVCCTVFHPLFIEMIIGRDSEEFLHFCIRKSEDFCKASILHFSLCKNERIIRCDDYHCCQL